MSVFSFSDFIKLMKSPCTGSWVSPRDRVRGDFIRHIAAASVFCHCDSIDFPKSVALSDFRWSFVSLVTSTSTLWNAAHARMPVFHYSILYNMPSAGRVQHTVTWQHVSVFFITYRTWPSWRPGCQWVLWRRGRARGLEGYRLGQFLEPLKHPSHDLLVAIWQDQYCVQGRVGRQRPKGHLRLLVYCLVETSATADQHAGIWLNPYLHLVARLSHAPDPFCPWQLSQLSRHIYELGFLKCQSWIGTTKMLVSRVSAPTPAFRSESKTFQLVQVSQQDVYMHPLWMISTKNMYNIH